MTFFGASCPSTAAQQLAEQLLCPCTGPLDHWQNWTGDQCSPGRKEETCGEAGGSLLGSWGQKWVLWASQAPGTGNSPETSPLLTALLFMAFPAFPDSLSLRALSPDHVRKKTKDPGPSFLLCPGKGAFLEPPQPFTPGPCRTSHSASTGRGRGYQSVQVQAC